jgi:hypothetical protein
MCERKGRCAGAQLPFAIGEWRGCSMKKAEDYDYETLSAAGDILFKAQQSRCELDGGLGCKQCDGINRVINRMDRRTNAAYVLKQEQEKREALQIFVDYQESMIEVLERKILKWEYKLMNAIFPDKDVDMARVLATLAATYAKQIHGIRLSVLVATGEFDNNREHYAALYGEAGK